MVRKITVVLLAAVATSGLVVTSHLAWAQQVEPADTYSVNYYRNAQTEGAPDGAVEVVNPGLQGDSSPAGDLCANIYVFDKFEQLKECCSCRITPNGLLDFDVNFNLTSNPLNGVKATKGVFKLVSGTPIRGVCTPAEVNPTPDLRAWGVHVQNVSTTGGFVLTEDEFLDSPLSSSELQDLTEDCAVAFEVGSGTGICSCGDPKKR